MDILLKIFGNILPVIAFIPIGYWLSRKFSISSQFITKPLLYFLLPLVVIHKVTEADPSKLFVITSLSFLLALAMNIPAMLVHKSFAKDEDTNFLRSTFAFFNVAFFGVPVVSALHGEKQLSTLFCIYLGTALYGDIIAYYQVTRTKHSVKDAIVKVLKTPYIYTFIFAILLKVIAFETPEKIKPILDAGGWVASAAGMLIIGLSLDSLYVKRKELAYYSKILAIRTLAALILVGALVFLEMQFIQKLESKDYLMLALLPLFPVASNIALFAAFVKTHEQKFAKLVLISIIVSSLLVPLVAIFIS